MRQSLFEQRMQAARHAKSDRLDHLVEATGLDPRRDLRYGDWRGIDLAEADVRDYNFTSCDLTDASFRNALIAGAIFDRAACDLQSLRQAMDFEEYLKRELSRPAESRQLTDQRLKEFEIFRDTPLCPELVVIPAGEFLMGSEEAKAQLVDDRAYINEIVPGQGKRRMRIVRRFALGRYPVTLEEYVAFLDATAGKRARDWGRGRRPVIHVDWQDAERYCAWLNRTAGLRGDFGYRLPSEAEWEYACRAGTSTRRWWGDKWDPGKANGNRSFEGGNTSPVDNYAANPWGLHDMIGNVYEWCADHYADMLALPADGAPYLDTKGGFLRVLRGGSWNNDPRDLRSAVRSKFQPDDRNNNVGFRVARTLLPLSS